MKKILIISILIILLTSCINNTAIEVPINNTDNTLNNSLKLNNTGSVEKTKEEIQAEKIKLRKEKVEKLRKKLALRGLIVKGDINLRNKDYTSALVKYIQIHKKIPEDKSIIQKLGNVYFNLKKFKKSYEYYKQVVDYDKFDKDKAALALISSKSLEEKNIKYLNKELDSLGLSDQQLFYYKTSINCVEDFDICKNKFIKYFEEKEAEKKSLEEENNIIEGTGSIIIQEEKFEELYNIKKAFDNYKNFQIDDLFYERALISGSFFENLLYPVAIKTSKDILEEKKEYKPLLKIIAKSYFELGNYIDAKLYLIKYNKLVKNDAEVSYFLGIVYEKLHEYILSTIHFKKALTIGNTNILDINKRLVFNYYEIGEIDKMLKIFDTIIDNYESELIENDYNLAIYYNLINEKFISAKKIALIAIEKYPQSELFNGYMGWILMEEISNELIPLSDTISANIKKEGNNNSNIDNIYKEAEVYINKGIELNSKNPMITLVKGKLEMKKGLYSKAFIYFKKTVALDNNGDFGKIAKQELEKIKVIK